MKKTALVLSGGGSRGAYEIGVWKALMEQGIKIDMVLGTSVGAINGAMVAQGDLELSERLWKQLETDMVFDVSKEQQSSGTDNREAASAANSTDRLAKDEILHGRQTDHTQDYLSRTASAQSKKLSEELQKIQQSLKESLSTMDIGGMPAEDALTYAKEIVTSGGAGSYGLRSLLENYIDEEKVRKSGIEYGLVTTEYPSLEGHFMYLDDIPEGALIDYIMASASCFPAVQKCIIDDKRFIDGGYRDNMPVEMAMERGATSIIAVDLQAAGFVRKNTVEEARKNSEEFHLMKSTLDLGNFLIFDKDNTWRIMQLGYLDAMREFGKYEGRAYTFERGAMTAHELLGAESIATILSLDPTQIYTKASLKKAAIAALSTEVVTNAEDSEADMKTNPDVSTKITSGAIETNMKNDSDATCDMTDAKGIKQFLARFTGTQADAKLHIQLLLYIAGSLKTEKENSLFLRPKLFKILEKEIQAANYLIRQKIL